MFGIFYHSYYYELFGWLKIKIKKNCVVTRNAKLIYFACVIFTSKPHLGPVLLELLFVETNNPISNVQIG